MNDRAEHNEWMDDGSQSSHRSHPSYEQGPQRRQNAPSHPGG